MFGALFFERDPLRLGDLASGVLLWVQDAGGFAAVGVLLWLVVALPRLKARDRAAIPRMQSFLFVAALIVSLTCYSLAGAVSLFKTGSSETLHLSFMAAGGGFALLAAGLSFFRNLGKLSFRRIYALAKLSFKEAVRRRVLYAFSGFLLVFLFASWYIPSKSEDQVRTYVQVFFQAMSVLLLFTAVILSAFSIPTDIKQQTIHTIVTKPVERFEVVLGRFLGFLALMTLVLLVVTSVSLVMVLRGVNPDAATESLKAREPLYGNLRFENTDSENKAVNVGREWEYRSYITKPNPGQLPQTACWDFAQVPAALGDRPEVRCEYGFDVYRTTKGQEGLDVSCTFKFYTWRFLPHNDEAFRKERGPAVGDKKKDDALAEKFGYFEINSLPVTDYHTQQFFLPGGLFRNASQDDPARDSELKARGQARPPALVMRVTCDSATQYVGVARYDLYVRLDDSEGSETTQFAVNFFKGAFGLWLRLALIIGLAVVLSTYLSGVVSLLVALMLYIGGTTKEFIQKVSLGQNEGGGPTEAAVRMARGELTGVSMRDSQSTGDRIITASDDVFRWVVRRILNIIPEVDRYDLTAYVAEGFNVSWEQMLMAFLLLVGYLLPWAVLAYFLIKWREIASPS